MSENKNSGWLWHCFHNQLITPCTDIAKRLRTIDETKPANEIPTRKRLLKRVDVEMPEDIIKAKDVYDEAKEALGKAREASYKINKAYNKACEATDKKACEATDKAFEAYHKAAKAYYKAWDAYTTLVNNHSFLIALHKKECGCKEWNGKEIVFPKDLKEKK